MIRITRDPKYAPCGYLVMREPFDKYDEKNTILFQTDWDFPGLARTFRWNMAALESSNPDCQHEGTDGTVTCRGCGMTADMFIMRAMDYLDSVLDCEEVEDPGYFESN